MSQKTKKTNMQGSQDIELAYDLHKQLNCVGVTENAIIPKDSNKENYKPRTLIDQTLELIDPTPNIHTLFVQFNGRFFWNILLPVEVKWSNRMTSCAGVCTFHPRNRQCVISLSLPLLKLRPRKDLVETLLHEMIHGYLFLTNNDRDRDGHGPEFCKHMNRINKEAGTNITIYHSFHAEVKLYQQHWWKCNGPCQHKPPYFGTVRRSMNRAPGPSDYWWSDHQRSCGGQFIKVKEPENYKSKKGSNQKTPAPVKIRPNSGNMLQWLTQNDKSKNSPIAKPSSSKIVNGILVKNPAKTCNSDVCSGSKGNKKNEIGIKKLGNSANNIHGWGTGGPKGSCKSNISPPSNNANGINNNSPSTSKRTFSSSGTVGGSGRGYSKLLDQFCTPKKNTKNNRVTFGAVVENDILPSVITPKKSILKRTSSQIDIGESQNDQIKCFVCNLYVFVRNADAHVNACLDSITPVDQKSREHIMLSDYNSSVASPQCKKQKNDNEQSRNIEERSESATGSECVSCPVCSKIVKAVDINNHLDNLCLPQYGNIPQTNNDVIVINDSLSESVSSDEEFNSVTDNSNKPNTPASPLIIRDSHKCLVCDTLLQPGTSLNEHLEECVGSIFNDESIASELDNAEGSTEIVQTDDKYLCPVCLEGVLKDHMNEHLDMCLKMD